MRLIDADALLEKMKKTDRYFNIVFDIEAAPTVNIVRCRECKYLKQNRVTGTLWCDRRAHKVIVIPNDYCSFGVRDEK